MRIEISILRQELHLYDADNTLQRIYPVSTSKNGVGEISGSECTPRGQHRIRAKIGVNEPAYQSFVGRRPTGELWQPGVVGKDWILGRILWLVGEEPGRNRLGNVDSMRRYIYIHGTGDDQPMGQPASIGCVRMRTGDVLELFDLMAVGDKVIINE